MLSSYCSQMHIYLFLHIIRRVVRQIVLSFLHENTLWVLIRSASSRLYWWGASNGYPHIFMGGNRKKKSTLFDWKTMKFLSNITLFTFLYHNWCYSRKLWAFSGEVRKKYFEGWAQDCSNSNIFLKPLFRGNFDPFVNNATLGAIAHTSNGT